MSAVIQLALRRYRDTLSNFQKRRPVDVLEYSLDLRGPLIVVFGESACIEHEVGHKREAGGPLKSGIVLMLMPRSRNFIAHV
jgi:hypothetical protein